MSADVDLLTLVHARPGITRADAVRELGIGSGRAVDLVAGLRSRRLLDEQAADATGQRGRPTTRLVAHPRGPVVIAAAITHDSWRVALVELGGAIVATNEAAHDGRPDATVQAVRDSLLAMRRRAGARVRGVAVSVPAVVRDAVVLQASNLGWTDVDLRPLWPRPAASVRVQVGNDASFAGWAESRRGAAIGAVSALHLRVDTGIGGTFIARGAPIPGGTDIGGEFGHMPFGDSRLACECGARGCWDLMVDGRALARALHVAAPPDPAAYLRRTIASGDAAAGPALAAVAAALGRGIAGLVNALDPHLVTLGGSAADLLAAAPEALQSAYRGGLMTFRRSTPVPLAPAELAADGPLIGAAETAFARVLTAEGVAAWVNGLTV